MFQVGESDALPYFDKYGNLHEKDLEKTLRLTFFGDKRLALKVEESRFWHIDKQSERVVDDDTYFYLPFANGEKEIDIWVSLKSMKNRLHIKDYKYVEAKKSNQLFQLMQSRAESLYPIYRAIRVEGEPPTKQLFRLMYTAFKEKNSQKAYFLQNSKRPIPTIFFSRNEEEGEVTLSYRSTRGPPGEFYVTKSQSAIKLPEWTFDEELINKTLAQFKNAILKLKAIHQDRECPSIQERIYPVYAVPEKEGKVRFAGYIGSPVKADLYQLWGVVRRCERAALLSKLIQQMLSALQHLKKHQIIHFAIESRHIYWKNGAFQLGEFGKARTVEEIVQGERSFIEQRNWKELPHTLRSDLGILASTEDDGLVWSGFCQFDLYCFGKMLWYLTDENRSPENEVITLLQFDSSSIIS